MKSMKFFIVMIVSCLALAGCAKENASNQNVEYFDKDDSTLQITETSDKDDVSVTKSELDNELLVAYLTADDMKVVSEINAESNLFCNLYESMGEGREPYEVQAGESSSMIAVRIPKNTGDLRVKEITLCDKEYNLYGMSIGIEQEDFEKEMIKRNYTIDKQHDSNSFRYESFKKGNIYVAINYDENSKVNRIFINLLVECTEWREVE